MHRWVSLVHVVRKTSFELVGPVLQEHSVPGVNAVHGLLRDGVSGEIKEIVEALLITNEHSRVRDSDVNCDVYTG